MTEKNWTRRNLLAVGAALAALPAVSGSTNSPRMITREIPSSGERLPVVGLGTYRVFDVASNPVEIEARRKIVELLINSGASLLDTSPMYNRAEKVIGEIIRSGVGRDRLFLATKVWTAGQPSGAEQMLKSRELMRTDVIDLMQVHNLRDTAVHMQTIRQWQQSGRIRYSGLTHYKAGAHDALGCQMQQFKPEFIQLNYSLGERDAENRLLPMAKDLGVAVLINRPSKSGEMFRAVSGKKLPEWAAHFANSWSQFFLKFIISHPAVTCVIPATSKANHMLDNLGAGIGELPDTAERKRMSDFFSSL